MPDARGWSRRAPVFEDTDSMPFGKHEHNPLQDVPASYLKYMYEKMKDEMELTSANITPEQADNLLPFRLQQLKFYNYCHNSMDAILMELGEKKRS